MDWREYEVEICNRLREQFPGTELEFNVRLPGRISGADRQIDILARGHMLDTRPFAVIDCKQFSRPVDVTVVEAFLGMLADVGAHVGVLVTNVGYSAAAMQRAERDQTRDLRLHVVKVSELRTLPTYRVLYFGAVGVRISLLPGWEMDSGKERIPGLATWDILPKGMSRDSAYRLPRWGCISIFPVPPNQSVTLARRFLADRHQVAEKRGHVQYRAENDGIRDITYCRVQATDGTVEFSATLASEKLIAMVELHTRAESQEHYEQVIVMLARSIQAIELHLPDGVGPSQDIWATAVNQASNLAQPNDNPCID